MMNWKSKINKANVFIFYKVDFFGKVSKIFKMSVYVTLNVSINGKCFMQSETC